MVTYGIVDTEETKLGSNYDYRSAWNIYVIERITQRGRKLIPVLKWIETTAHAYSN